MAKKFSVSDVLGAQSQAAAPAGQTLDVVQLPIDDIRPNPENKIYEIGNITLLQASISQHGLRTPLEVAPARGGKYMLIAGHRRYTACRALYDQGDVRFALLPCVVRDYGNADEELVALITSNATARELTNGERLRQYEALKGALTRLKERGEIKGRVREAMVEITGKSGTSMARMNAIISRCVPEVRAMLERGEITMTRAFDCSKLYKVQQVAYAKTGYGPMPSLTPEEKEKVVEFLVRNVLRDKLAACDYGPSRDQWNFCSMTYLDFGPVVIRTDDGEKYWVDGSLCAGIQACRLDPGDETEFVAKSIIPLHELYPLAKELYCPPEVRQAQAQAQKDQRAAAQKARDEEKQMQALAQESLAAYDTWPKVAQAKELGLAFRAYPLYTGGRLVVAVDETTRREGFPGLPYETSFYARFDAQGRRVDMATGEQTPNKSLMAAWRADGALESVLLQDIKARTIAEDGK